jgi:hypothetical protein
MSTAIAASTRNQVSWGPETLVETGDEREVEGDVHGDHRGRDLGGRGHADQPEGVGEDEQGQANRVRAGGEQEAPDTHRLLARGKRCEDGGH